MKSIRLCLAVLAVLAFSLGASAAEAELSEPIILNKIVAVVNGEIVTMHELRQHAASEFARAGIDPRNPAARRQVDAITSRVLSVMIDDILLRQEAERLQVKVSDADIDNEIRKLAQRNQTNLKDFEARVVAQGGSMATVREHVRNSILSNRIIGVMIARKIVITEEEVKEYYEAHQRDFMAERSVDISLIVFAPSANPGEIYDKIRGGSLSFEDAARKFSEGPAPDNGGRLGMIPWDDLAPPFKAQVLQMKEGEVSGVFSVNTRDYLLKFNGATSGRSMTLEEATPEIERLLREPRLQERFTEYTDQLRSRAVIDIRI